MTGNNMSVTCEGYYMSVTFDRYECHLWQSLVLPVTGMSVTCDRYECQQVAVCDQQWQWSVHVQCCRVITVFCWLCWPRGCDSNERHHSTTRSVSRHTLTNPGLLSQLISASNSIIYGWLTTVKYSFVENLLQACKDFEVFLIGHIVITYLYIKIALPYILNCYRRWIFCICL